MFGEPSRRLLFLFVFVVFGLAAAGCGGSPTAPAVPTLKLTAVSPSSGSTSGGTNLTLTGAEFAADATVVVGGVPATNVVFVGPTTLTAVVAARPTAGAAAVDVTSGGKTVSLPNAFTFVAPSGTNQPPVITQIRSVGTRQNQPALFGDVGETLTLIASVTDNETPVDQLTYQWSGPGTFSAAAATTTWQVPDQLSTPTTITVTLTVTESYVEAGITQKNVSAPVSIVMQIHDSSKEILDKGEDFLTLFSNSSIPTDQVLHNFSTTCDSGSGRAEEKDDVDENRRTYTEDFSAFKIQRRPPVVFVFGGGSCVISDGRVQRRVDACSSFAVHWEVTKKSSGEREITNGVDWVSAVLENNEWKLCHSFFTGSQTYPSLGITVPVSW